MPARFPLFVLMLAAWVLPAAAQSQSPSLSRSLSDQVAAIESYLAANQPAEALRAARRLYASVAQAVGLQLGAPVLVTAPAEGLGIYTPREGQSIGRASRSWPMPRRRGSLWNPWRAVAAAWNCACPSDWTTRPGAS
jgi:hypothetical protein